MFTAGIGENAPQIRERVSGHLRWLGLALDVQANRRNGAPINAERSKAMIFVIPTDEERMIGRHTLRRLREHGTAELGAASV